MIWVFGGLDTQGRFIDWAAIGALGTIGAAVATVLAVGTLAFAARELQNRAEELRRQAEADRVTRLPYLRVDIGLDGIAANGFTPPHTEHLFDADDFDPSGSLGLFDQIAPSQSATDAMGLVLWVTNLQSAALGIAYKIEVKVLVAWDENDPLQTAETLVEFTYLAPGQTTAFKLTDIRTDLPWLFAKVVEVSYEDIFGLERLPESHGALTMLYDRNRGMRNERSFQLSR